MVISVGGTVSEPYHANGYSIEKKHNFAPPTIYSELHEWYGSETVPPTVVYRIILSSSLQSLAYVVAKY